MTAPELAHAAPHAGRVARTVDALEDTCDGASGQLVLVAVLLDEVANVRTDCLLLLARLLLVLQTNIVKRKVLPEPQGPQGGADLRFITLSQTPAYTAGASASHGVPVYV